MVAGPLAAPGGGAPARSLYRSLLRTARRMPDDHRTAFVVHRVRSEFEKSRKVAEQATVAARLHEGEVYRDQLELQAAHLSALAKQALLIPVDLRAPVVASSSSSVPSTSSSSSTPRNPTSATTPTADPSSRKGPSRPPRRRPAPVVYPSDPNASPAAEAETAPPSSDARPSSSSSSSHPPPPPLDRRKLLRAFSARDTQSEVKAARTNRFMQGPEPSWVLRRRRRREQEQEQEKGGTAEKRRGGGDHGEGLRLTRGAPRALDRFPFMEEFSPRSVMRATLARRDRESRTSRARSGAAEIGPVCQPCRRETLQGALRSPSQAGAWYPLFFIWCTDARENARTCRCARTESDAKSNTTSEPAFAPDAGKKSPDEPDPAFEDFFPGTKRYTPRSRTGKGWKKQKAFFFLHMLESTSAYLATLFAPQIASYEEALETDPLVELDDFLAYSALAPPLRRELDERAE
ncbi:hypothetical protein C6P46_002912 [Rhodotorula mucilaginosa]|uniref:Complex 1 LYR protein domain-containing protein n=1 Tax=Rhodotorula mucilaginosa TaxID=5537 RepID=A0A9P6W3W6_RHOMI|nr:hypothetical protein C6P46_002912 [Rhodotorula mucilaginosa]